jgi:hypothetical protein
MMRGKRVRMDTQLLELCIYGKKKVFLRKKKKIRKKRVFLPCGEKFFFSECFFFYDRYLVDPASNICLL